MAYYFQSHYGAAACERLFTDDFIFFFELLLPEDLRLISPLDLGDDVGVVGECVCDTVVSNSSTIEGGLLIGCWLTTGFFLIGLGFDLFADVEEATGATSDSSGQKLNLLLNSW